MILAIETSSTLCSVSFWENGKTFAEYESDAPMQHATLIGQFVEKGLKELKNPPRLVAVAIGPGSFTGLRIGLSYAQGFCFGREIPIVGVSNHQVLASQKISKTKETFTIIDARRNEVYLAKHKNDEIFEIESHQIIAIENLVEHIPTSAQLIGQQGIAIPENIVSELNEKGIDLKLDVKYSAAKVAQIGKIKSEKIGNDNIETIEPMYIRPFAGVQ
ncbi:MAG: tRNA (adenosine(37)-N6)-threonylcarbamoyltransferase complex dimerization subunit type 1 TsaB [Calditrichaeota bacterium]|nr:MAG: tRNA (adenosine(37)-N6)-threonylcarbamoyltransferase complex dimerization subunit type 1 TsaB [Calditrichota bacterium]MBL1205837.1 tRNA (adenosine(37)-N6)-threonylcarbamoyltransferase complex dimerization subunit type 1 TsaB [Calditrichota bacterium]NOG45664.1 tRNA (adenosine(37)-N6)-threonylcarbamoyltransferase complex dimerization subunit type 1 TsaB [Calditrichota bacterium]